MIRTVPEMAAFLGVTPRQLAYVFYCRFGPMLGEPPEAALDLANAHSDVALQDMVRVAKARAAEVFA